MIGKNIYEIRKRRGLTLSEVAERASISKSYLSNIERSLNLNPSIQVMEKIALVLDVDLKTLLKTGSSIETELILERELLEFVNDIRESGIDKEQIHEYKSLFEYIKWKKQNTEKGE